MSNPSEHNGDAIASPTPPPASEADVAAATQTLKALDEQGIVLRAELLRLQGALAGITGELAGAHARDLIQANEQLVLAALHAEAIAETALARANELALSGQRDALTGTPDRTRMLDRINAAIAMARRHDGKCAVMFLDLDDFKSINDNYGHLVGDEVLQWVAGRLQALVRQSDTVARHGGDEFIILLAEVGDESETRLVATKLLAGLAEPAAIQGYTLTLSASLGVALFPDHAEDAIALISRADVAMYQSKHRGKGGYEIYRSSGSAVTRFPATAHEGAPRLALQELRDLREANERLVFGALEAQDRLRSLDEDHQRQIEFLAMVAHELRSPLAPLGTAAELLKHAAVDDSVLGQVQAVIKRQVAHMSRLVDDLLAGSHGATGKFRLDRRPIAIGPVIAQAIESCRPAMQAARQIFTQQLPDEPLYVEGDSVRLAQVFSNLLDNASKYTPAEGKIDLRVGLRGDEVVITVSDNGVGVSSAALPRIFDLFVRDEHAVVNKRGSLGIGLAVVRDLVEAHGGSVSCISPGPGQGSTFTVVLPRMHGVGSGSA